MSKRLFLILMLTVLNYGHSYRNNVRYAYLESRLPTSLTTNEFMVIENNFTLSYADDMTLVPLTTENRPFW